MFLFNAIQITALFALLPFAVQWVSEATFKGAGAAFWVLIAGYLVSFGFTVAAWYEFMEKNR